MTKKDATKFNVKVWDLPIRIFHCLLVLSLAFQYITVNYLDDAISLHFYGGYFTLGLILFRILWGIWGSYHARFINFIKGPKRTLGYLKSMFCSEADSSSDFEHKYLGHNPLGALSIIAILVIVATQAISGLFISDDIFSDGPYYASVSSQIQDIANWLHHNLFNLVWAFLVIHLSAIVFYKFKKKQDLTKAMITGSKRLNKEASQEAIENPDSSFSNHWLRFTLTLIAVAVFVFLLVEVWPPEVVEDFYY